MAKLVTANDLAAPTTMLDDEDLAAWFIAQWYLAHRTSGGERDPVAAEVLAEVPALQASDIPALQPGGDQVH